MDPIRLIVILCLLGDYSSGYITFKGSRWFCNYPCQCPIRELKCVTGVSIVKDGCDCCNMCARQHGDLCNVKDKCDNKRDLYCDMSTKPHGPGTGICRAKSRKPCIIGNNKYPDGQKFKHPGDCSKLCTCQNGNYGCVDLCPDQYRIPSETHCRRPRLQTITGQCCKQWTCDTVEPKKISTSGIKPRHLTRQQPQMQPASLTLKATVYVASNIFSEGVTEKHQTQQTRIPGYRIIKLRSKYQMPKDGAYLNEEPYCTPSDSEWSRCSTKCNVGVSTRSVTSRNCQQKLETRLCFIRPCNVTLGPPSGRRCTPTIRLPQKQRVQYEDCTSVHELNFKVCTTCKDTRCCYPRREKTRHVDFECSGGRRQLFAFMWIKSCRCDRKCYEKDADDKGGY